MKCRDVLQLLHPYSDGELDLVRHVEMEKHLTGCAECAEQEKNLRSLRVAVSAPSLYHRAPPSLRKRIQLTAPQVTRRERRRVLMQFGAVAAGVLFLIATSATVGMFISKAGTSTDDRVAEYVVAGHVRSLQVTHATDVASSDLHTVKPWFRGKLDFSPHVPDLSPHGYSLSGGRLDFLVDRPVAALVYYRRLHPINVFSWPSANVEERAVRKISRHGFQMRDWQRDGMTYWAISDLNEQEFDEFVRLFREQTAALPP